MARSLAPARLHLGAFLGTSTVAPWHGHDNTLAWARNGLTSTIRKGVSFSRGGMGMKARETLEHALGGHARARPKDHGASHPEPVGLGLDRAPASTQGCLGAQLGTTKQTMSLKQCVP
ncbi:hypothetical protein Scep_014057 [Stephania cephalantha]|uniref:Uncharacterized protein n=1 Tax=Stephania cephalantha TaxID=152367 RepID=A0AAP0J0I6_9MAGN